MSCFCRQRERRLKTQIFTLLVQSSFFKCCFVQQQCSSSSHLQESRQQLVILSGVKRFSVQGLKGHGDSVDFWENVAHDLFESLVHGCFQFSLLKIQAKLSQCFAASSCVPTSMERHSWLIHGYHCSFIERKRPEPNTYTLANMCKRISSAASSSPFKASVR